METTATMHPNHVYNMTNIGLNIHSDMLCDISRKRNSQVA